ncbi:MAG: hypothetical protein GOV15_03475, partial [Candidatus Diapherotrites archaeon]|nr:hypothetical protein [Candidatus Diapherotrites archaeon]
MVAVLDKVYFDYNESKGDLLLNNTPVAVLNKGAIAKLQRDFEKIIGPTARNLIYRTMKQHTLDT